MNKCSGCKTSNNHEFLLSKYEKATLKYYQNKQIKSSLKNKAVSSCPFCFSSSVVITVHGPSSLTIKNVSEKTNSMKLSRTPNKNCSFICSACNSLF